MIVEYSWAILVQILSFWQLYICSTVNSFSFEKTIFFKGIQAAQRNHTRLFSFGKCFFFRDVVPVWWYNVRLMSVSLAIFFIKILKFLLTRFLMSWQFLNVLIVSSRFLNDHLYVKVIWIAKLQRSQSAEKHWVKEQFHTDVFLHQTRPKSHYVI